MLHTKYQGSMACGFWQEDFFKISLYNSTLRACVIDAIVTSFFQC